MPDPRARSVPCLRLGRAALVLVGLSGGLAPPSASAGSDRVFWQTAGRYRETRVLEDRSTTQSVIQLVEWLNHRDRAPSRAFVRRPRQLQPDYRILLTYVGRHTGETLLEMVPEQPDLVLVAVQYPDLKPRGLLRLFRTPRRLRQMGYRAIAAGLLAMDAIEEAGLDATRTVVVGASFGAGPATIHAALDPRVARLLIIHGGGNFRALLRAHFKRRGHGWYAWPLIGPVYAVIAPFDPIRYIRRVAPRPVMIIAARHDNVFPRECMQALYDAAGEPRSLVWTETAHVRSRPDAVSAELVRLATEFLSAEIPSRPPSW